MNGVRETVAGDRFPRLQMKAYNLDEDNERTLFIKNESKTVEIPGSRTTVLYHQVKKIGIITSKLGTSKAVSLGAYRFALNKLNK
jgi:glucokinase